MFLLLLLFSTPNGLNDAGEHTFSSQKLKKKRKKKKKHLQPSFSSSLNLSTIDTKISVPHIFVNGFDIDSSVFKPVGRKRQMRNIAIGVKLLIYVAYMEILEQHESSHTNTFVKFKWVKC